MPQSEEHLAIVDVLGAEAGVVALTKTDLVDTDTVAVAEEEIRERLAGTALEGSPVVACSAATGAGIDELRLALDDLVIRTANTEDRGRPRLDIDRSFSIRGAGTVVTGTLTGGSLAVGQEVVIHPAGVRARVRSLQTHRRSVDTARPVSRVAANLVGASREDVRRGDVLARPGQWRPTATIEVSLRPVRPVTHPLSGRGAFKVYIGTAERDARVHLYGVRELLPGGRAFARFRLDAPVVVAAGEHFVLREAGRRETVAGGVVLDPMPPPRAGPDPEARLAARQAALPDVAAPMVRERGSVRDTDIVALTGGHPEAISGAERLGPWWVAEDLAERTSAELTRDLESFHRQHPLRAGMDAEELRRGRGDVAAHILERLEERGVVVREGRVVRLATHRVDLGDREDDAARAVDAVAGGEPTPPTIRELVDAGFPRDLVEACVAVGRLVRVSPEVVVTPSFARHVEDVAVQEAGRPEGLTVSTFRERIGTTRKYAVPLLEWLDGRGITRRDGDVRRRGAAPVPGG
jgi:selenocysteine-specific elongation factor